MAVAPQGKEGTFAGLSHAVVFFADLPAGLLGGILLQWYCPQPPQPEQEPQYGTSVCDGRALFGTLGAFALATPVLLWCCPGCVREPDGALRSTSKAAANFGGKNRPSTSDEEGIETEGQVLLPNRGASSQQE